MPAGIDREEAQRLVYARRMLTCSRCSPPQLRGAASSPKRQHPPPAARPRVGLDTLSGEPIVKRMHKAGGTSILVTAGSGQLLGVLYREDAERHLDE